MTKMLIFYLSNTYGPEDRPRAAFAFSIAIASAKVIAAAQRRNNIATFQPSNLPTNPTAY
jgi:hypothetical protein